MMKDDMPHADDVRDWLVTDAKMMLADTEELLRAVGSESKERIASVKPRIEAGIERARARIAETEFALEVRRERA
jgi:ElaB/YqjD/DUF883 family membrane-anchored ribosome-binding protein